MSEKICTKCGQIQPFSEFYPDKKNSDKHSSYCKECNRAVSREYYLRNKVKCNAQMEAWAKEHAAERRAYMAAYQEANREKLGQQKRAYYQANKMRLNTAAAEYAQRNAEQIAAYQAQYYAEHGDVIRERARERGRSRDGYVRAVHSRFRRSHYKELRDEILTALGGKCYCCGVDDYRFLTIDHVQNDGKQERKPNGKGRNSYMVLRAIWESGCPRDRYQAACYNCNCARQLTPDKICPHQRG